ncbi:homeobox-domain-containing protein, partial [Neoconidiobolus thromboides FSU 785]
MSTYMSSKNENLDPLPSNEDNNDSDYRNGRRSRASREQVAILEESFKSNNQPSAKARELLAKKLNMPERTVQIWFQNRRAKIKLGQRKHHLALKEEALHNSQFNNSNNTNETSNTLNKNNNIFQCSILTIGTWRRMPLGNDELVCSYSIETNQMAWVIGDKMAKFRICFPFSSIKNMTLAFIDAIYAELSIEINGPPSFSTLNKDKVWSPCGDFTENHQASVNHKHVITGDAQSL